MAFQFLYEEVSIGYWIKFKEKQTPHVFCRDQKAYQKGVFFVNQTSSFVMTSPLIVLIKHLWEVTCDMVTVVTMDKPTNVINAVRRKMYV